MINNQKVVKSLTLKTNGEIGQVEIGGKFYQVESGKLSVPINVEKFDELEMKINSYDSTLILDSKYPFEEVKRY